MKCEHHEDYIKLHDGLRDHIDRVERTLDDKIKATDRTVNTAFKKIDDIRDDLDVQGKDHRETEVYVKQLYHRFDELAQQMQTIVAKLDAYITTMSSLKNVADKNSDFSHKGKELVFEIIKWTVFLALAAAINQN